VDVVGKNCIETNMLQHTVIGQVQSEKKKQKKCRPGTLQSLTLICSVYLRVQISVSLGEVTFTSF